MENYSTGRLTKRQKNDILRAQLDSERQSFRSQWQDLARNLRPMRDRFSLTNQNRGTRRHEAIIDTTPLLASRTLRSGMMSGITSPARPWFRLGIEDPDLAERGRVKEFVHFATTRMQALFKASNLYNELPLGYGDMGDFGTAALFVEEDTKDILRFRALPIGSYMLANDARGMIAVFFRDFRMTVRELVEKFGEYRASGQANWDKFTNRVRNFWDNGQYEEWIDVCHVIQPNEMFDPNRAELDAKYKKFAECYYEAATGAGTGVSAASGYDDKYLSESGYDYFPVLCPRWEVTSGDVYATDCPGMTALGDIKQLQVGERRGLQAVDKMINPPMIGPSALRTQKVTLLPGDINYHDTEQGKESLRALHEIQFRLDALEAKQAQVRERIQRAYYEDVFLKLINTDRRQITAREIEEIGQEKLTALGPVLERVDHELLDPLIDIAFDAMVKRGVIRPEDIPDELRGQPLKVEYISIMAQAQKLAGISSIDRFLNFYTTMLPVAPEIRSKVNTDRLTDVYGDLTSVAPGIVRSDEDAQTVRDVEAQAARKQMQAEEMRNRAGAIKDLSQSSLDGGSALQALMNDSELGDLSAA